MQVLSCFLVTALFVTLATADVAPLECASQMQQHLNFGLRFSDEIEDALDHNFAGKLCTLLLDTFLKDVDTYIGKPAWEKMTPESRRRFGRITFNNIQARAAADLLPDKLLGTLLRDDLFGGPIFEDEALQGKSCSTRVLEALKVKQPLSPQLVGHLDYAPSFACGPFVSKLKSSLKELTNLSSAEWLTLGENAKRSLARSVLVILHVQALKKAHSSVATASERAWSQLAKNGLFLEDIFASNVSSTPAIKGRTVVGGNNTVAANGTVTTPSGVSSERTWSVLIWLVLIFTVLITVFMALRFFDIIPGLA